MFFSKGACDQTERCDGRTNDCPSDAKHSSSRVCRSSAGKCDVEEKCDGKSDDCPTNAFRPSSYVCQAGKDCLDDAKCPGNG